MDNDKGKQVVINMLKEAVESEGCKLTDVDLKNMIIKVDGSDEVVDACARAVAEIMD